MQNHPEGTKSTAVTVRRRRKVSNKTMQEAHNLGILAFRLQQAGISRVSWARAVHVGIHNTRKYLGKPELLNAGQMVVTAGLLECSPMEIFMLCAGYTAPRARAEGAKWVELGSRVLADVVDKSK